MGTVQLWAKVTTTDKKKYNQGYDECCNKSKLNEIR